jgi:hypothetical protein
MPGEDLEVFLSFNQRPFGYVSDDLKLAVKLPNGAWFNSTDGLEGTKRVFVPASTLDGIDSVRIDVVGEVVGVGNHTGVLGSDGDLIGFALSARGVARMDAIADLDGDGVPDSEDGCPADGDKSNPGVCGCGNSDDNYDSEGVVYCIDALDRWLIILLCTVFALIVIGAVNYFKLVWLPESRERKGAQELESRNSESSSPNPLKPH